MKNYLKTVVGYCQSEREVLALELNPLASNPRNQVILAFSHLSKLVDKGFFLVYPYPHWGNLYIKEFIHSIDISKMNFINNSSSSSKSIANETFPFMDDVAGGGTVVNLPQPTLVVVPASAVVQAKKNFDGGPRKDVKCVEKTQWNETIREIEENIESYFPANKWQRIKNLAKEIMRNPMFCVKTDGKTFHIKERPRTEVSLIDFLAIATRRAGPMERERDPTWKLYSMHVETLLKNNAPKDLFKNKVLIPKRFRNKYSNYLNLFCQLLVNLQTEK